MKFSLIQMLMILGVNCIVLLAVLIWCHVDEKKFRYDLKVLKREGK